MLGLRREVGVMALIMATPITRLVGVATNVARMDGFRLIDFFLFKAMLNKIMKSTVCIILMQRPRVSSYLFFYIRVHHTYLYITSHSQFK